MIDDHAHTACIQTVSGIWAVKNLQNWYIQTRLCVPGVAIYKFMVCTIISCEYVLPTGNLLSAQKAHKVPV